MGQTSNNRMRIVSVLILGIAATTLHAVTLELVNGDRLHGEVAHQDEASLTLNHPLLGELVIPRTSIVATSEDKTTETATTTSTKTPGGDTPQDAKSPGAWKRQLAIGLNGSNGKSDDFNLHLELNADFKDARNRWNLRSRYDRNQSDGELSDHSFFADLRRDWLLPESPWFRFAGARYDWDEFGDWDHRLSGNGGIGYDFVKRENWHVQGRTGLGGQQTFGDLREEFTPEALAGIEVTWKPGTAQSLHFINTLYPSLLDPGEFRDQTTIEWSIDIERTKGLAVKLSVNNEYDSLAEESAWSDFNYTGSLLWNL